MQASASRSVLDDTTRRMSEDNAGRRRRVGPADTTPANTAPAASRAAPDVTRADMTAGIRTTRAPSSDNTAAARRHLRTDRPLQLSASAAVTRAVLTAVMLMLTAAISVGAGWLSFLAVRDLAVLAGWPAATAWAVQPVVELFLVVGSLEIVCRAWEGRTDLRYPTALIAAALVVVLAANVVDHVLQAAAERRSGPMLAVVGLLAALVPAAQLGSLHLISGRLHSLGGRTTGSPAAATTLADAVPSANIHPSQDTAAAADVLVPADNRTDTDGSSAWPQSAVSAPSDAPADVRPAPRRTADNRTALVAAVLSGRLSPAEAARRAGRDVRTIRRWVAAFRAGTQPDGSTPTANRPRAIDRTG
jgi:hypothetical protein